jgi:hypothetical protein
VNLKASDEGGFARMSGISWSTIGDDKFENIIDILLGREFGIRGHAVDGRGGDGGVDYEVDDGKIIFQYKYFWNGITVSRTRKAQIEKSFKKAMENDREEWILVVPAKLTPHERRFITGLGKGRRIKITIRDKGISPRTSGSDQISICCTRRENDSSTTR